MKIRSMFLPLIASGLMGLSATSFAVSASTQFVRIAGISLALISNSPLIEAVRGTNDASAKPKLRHLKKSKCGTTGGATAVVCDDFCTNAIPTGTELKSCTDSDAVNTYTCTYEEVSGANCFSCPTDDETGLWFERKNIKTGDPCMVTCEYSNPDRSEEADCADICVGKNPYTDILASRT
ncbi:MAG: hypothetical protein AB8G05_01570 [Oligoflexales bacterium]